MQLRARSGCAPDGRVGNVRSTPSSSFCYPININRIALRIFHRFLQFFQRSCLGPACESFCLAVGAQTSDPSPFQAFHEIRAITSPYPHVDPPVKPTHHAISLCQTPTDWGLPLAGLISRFSDFLTPKLSEPFGEGYDTCVYSFAVRVSCPLHRVVLC